MRFNKILLLIFISAFASLSFFSLAYSSDTSLGQAQGKAPEKFRFESIPQLNGEMMAAEVTLLLNQYGWEGWGHKKYDFGGWNADQMKEKRKLFDDWSASKGFKWIDPIWSFSGNDVRVVEILSGCQELIHPVIAVGTKVETRPAPLILPLDVGVGPIAVYLVGSSKASGFTKRHAVVVKFNDLLANKMTSGEEIRRDVPFFFHSVYLLDLNACEYQHLLNLNGSYLGGYTKESISRLVGVGYHNERLVIYDVYDTSPAFQSAYLAELHADLYSFDLSLPSKTDTILELFFRPNNIP